MIIMKGQDKGFDSAYYQKKRQKKKKIDKESNS